MGKKKPDKDISRDIEQADDELAREDAEESVEDGSRVKGKRDESSAGSSSRNRFFMKKPVFLALFVAILAALIMGIRFLPGLLETGGREGIVSMDIDDAGLSEKELSPFFIPPLKGTGNSAIRIDLSAVWNRLAEVRFEKNEIQIRSSLYGSLKEIVVKNNDLEAMIPLMEEKMTMVFRESLGVRNLVIKIREIRYI